MSERPPNEHFEREEQPWPMPRIYVASLSDYNAGRLHGTWVDAVQEAGALQDDIDVMLGRSLEAGAEEWAIHDSDGFGLLQLRESEDLEFVSRLGKGIAKHGPAFAAFAELVGDDELLDSFDGCYRGQWNSVAEYAEELLTDIGTVAEIEAGIVASMRPYVKIDFAALGRDMELGGELFVIRDGGGGIFVFSPG